MQIIFGSSSAVKVDGFVPDQLKKRAIEPWQKEIIAFLEHWYDTSNSVEMLTSGSTGKPKVIHLPKKTMLRSAEMTNTFFNLTSESVGLLCLPASYIAGKMMLLRAIAGNYTLIALQPSANPFVQLNQGTSVIDFTAITPHQLMSSAVTLSLGKVRNCIVGGSPVTLAMESIVSDWPTAMYETFGMTETASHIALRRFNGTTKSHYFEVLNGVELSLDHRGCLEIYAPHLHNEKLITNDLVDLVDARYFRWLGRVDRVVNSGGIKIFPEMVERKIQDLIDLPYFVSSVPHPALGQQLILVLESDTLPITVQQEIITALQPRLDKYELPGKLIFIPSFVYSSANKILRSETLAKG